MGDSVPYHYWHPDRKSTKTVIRVASIVLVVLLKVSLIGLLMVPSVNAEVKNVFADWFDMYVSYENKSRNRLLFQPASICWGIFRMDLR